MNLEICSVALVSTIKHLLYILQRDGYCQNPAAVVSCGNCPFLIHYVEYNQMQSSPSAAAVCVFSIQDTVPLTETHKFIRAAAQSIYESIDSTIVLEVLL